MMAAALALVLAAVEPAPPAAFAEIDRSFACPEALAGDQARMDALKDFMTAAAKAAPAESIPRLMQYRRRLLEKHSCAQTLRSLEQSEARVRAGQVLDQAWVPIGSTPTVQLFVSATYVKPYEDPRDPTAYAVETYVRLTLSAPAETNVTHTRYDQVVSHNVYYCGKASYALIGNDYFLAGQSVLKDPSPSQTVGAQTVYEIKPIPSGSPNAAAARSVCAANPGGTT
jgi:hypothetical protein